MVWSCNLDGKTRNGHRIFVEKGSGRHLVGRPGIWEYNMKMNFMELDCEDWRLRIVSSGVEYLVSSSKEFIALITIAAAAAAVVVVIVVWQ
jgi:hypothetical protein